MATMTLAALQATKQFQSLSAQQRLWVLSYLESGDFHFATQAAYNVEGESARVHRYNVLKSAGIQTVLRIWESGVFLENLKTELAAQHTGKVKTQIRKLIALVKAETK